MTTHRDKYPADYGYGDDFSEWYFTALAWVGATAVILGPALLVWAWLR